MKISVFGAPGNGQSQLLADLEHALNISGWPATVQIGDHTQVLENSTGPSHNHELILLMGIEISINGGIKGEKEGRMNTGLTGHRDADQRIRATLGQLDKPYDVLYGSAEERLAQALALIKNRTNKTAGSYPARPGPNHKPWIWACEKCSDWQCEHRLLTDLLASRLTAA